MSRRTNHPPGVSSQTEPTARERCEAEIDRRSQACVEAAATNWRGGHHVAAGEVVPADRAEP